MQAATRAGHRATTCCTFVDARDAAFAFVAAIERGRPGERDLLGGPNWTLKTCFGRLERLAKVAGPRLRVPRWARFGAELAERVAEWRGGEPLIDKMSVEMPRHFWYLDGSKARAELGSRRATRRRRCSTPSAICARTSRRRSGQSRPRGWQRRQKCGLAPSQL